MYSPASSSGYRTHYLCWPEHLPKRCPKCQSPLEYAFAGNGKKVYRLHETIHQVINFYQCSNSTCTLRKHYINPASRYDFGRSYYGKDVLEFIAEEIYVLEQTPKQIYKRLTLKYDLEISLRTVQRFYRDLLQIKAHQIDQKTYDMISKNGRILLAVDGQDPDKGHEALWLFTDLLTNRVLRTTYTASMPHQKLHEEIEAIKNEYDVEIIGVVSDKQNNLVKCMKKYYDGIPHQYCTFHFCQQLWKHLDSFDNQLYRHLKQNLTRSYIHKASHSHTPKFKKVGEQSIRTVFKQIDNDFRQMIRIKSKKFKFLRGLWLYRRVLRYAREMEKYEKYMQKNLRINKIYHNLVIDLNTVLENNRIRFFKDLFLYDSFKLIYQRIYAELPLKEEKIAQISLVFDKIWGVALGNGLDKQKEDLRSILVSSKHSFPVILGEWTRLWHSYRPGLFAYYDFPIIVQTNTLQEQAFSQEITKLTNRLKRADVSYFIKTRGDLYLKLIHATDAELSQSIVEAYSQKLIESLREDMQNRISAETRHWLFKDKEFTGFERVLRKYHPEWRKIQLKKKTEAT